MREITELLLSLTGDYNNVIEERIAFGYNYEQYLSQRDSIAPSFYTFENGTIVKLSH